MTVGDPLLDRRHQPRVRDRLKTVGDVRLGNPSPAPPRLINENLERVVRRAPGPKPERALEHVSLEDRLNDDLGGRLNDTVADSGNRERTPLLRSAGLRDEHPAGRKRTPAPVLEVRGQLIEQLGRRRTPRRRRWSVGRCRPRHDWRAPAPTRALERLCGRSCRRARGTVARDRPWPPGKAFVAVLGLCPAWWS